MICDSVNLKGVVYEPKQNSFNLQSITTVENLFRVQCIDFISKRRTIITHLAGQTYVWHGCKWNFAGPQIYLQPAKIKSQYSGVSLKF